jgi:hypothetical protein
MNTPHAPRYLTLEEVENHLRAGLPICWVIIHDDEAGTTVEMAIDGRAVPRSTQGGAP